VLQSLAERRQLSDSFEQIEMRIGVLRGVLTGAMPSLTASKLCIALSR
jgi:hypothetical protein